MLTTQTPTCLNSVFSVLELNILTGSYLAYFNKQTHDCEQNTNSRRPKMAIGYRDPGHSWGLHWGSRIPLRDASVIS